MSVSFRFDGLEELREALRNLPAALAGEGADIVEAAATDATATIHAGYPSWTGELRDKLTVTHTRSAFGARSVIKNTATFAAAFERGSEARHYVTRNGAQHLTGKMPPNPLFSQTIVRARRTMWRGLADLLTRHGLTVTGTP